MSIASLQLTFHTAEMRESANCCSKSVSACGTGGCSLQPACPDAQAELMRGDGCQGCR